MNHPKIGTEMEYEIIVLQKEDIASTVETHIAAFPNFFLAYLGPVFLAEFYSSFLLDPRAIAFVAKEKKDEGKAVGFIVGTSEPPKFFRRLIKNRWWAFCIASARALCRKPRIAPRILRALAYRGDRPPGPKRALLSSIAVVPEVQNRGLGRMLLARWIDEAKSQGSKGCYLTTDADNNEAVNEFYCRSGWKLKSTSKTPEGRKMNTYVLDFVEDEEL